MFGSSDLEYRKQFSENKNSGKENNRQGYKSAAVNSYTKALNVQNNIQLRNAQDERDAAIVCKNIAVIKFNQSQYYEAAVYYQHAITYLDNIKKYENLLDSDYRDLINHYIGLVDSYRHIELYPKANEALAKAVEALHMIQSKTPEENQVIQAAIMGDEYVAFYNMIEGRTCTENYMKSDNHKADIADFTARQFDNAMCTITNSFSTKTAFGTATIGMFGTQQQSATQREILWGKQQPNNTNDNDNQPVMGMDI